MLKQKLEVQVAYFLKNEISKEKEIYLIDLDEYGEIQWETVNSILKKVKSKEVVAMDNTEIMPYLAEFDELVLLGLSDEEMEEEIYEALQELNKNNSYNERNEDTQDGGRQDANPNEN